MTADALDGRLVLDEAEIDVGEETGEGGTLMEAAAVVVGIGLVVLKA